MQDFLGKEIKEDTFCVFVINRRTGSSTIRKVLCKGMIERKTKQKVWVKEENGNTHCIYPEDVVQI